MSCSILVPEQAVKTVLKRLQRLAKKAGVAVETVPGTSCLYRKKCVVRSYRSHDGETRQYSTLEVDQNYVLECARVTVGDLPRNNGYVFLGKLVHTEAGNMLAMATHAREVKLPPEWREAKPTCDHCKTKRSRTETFIIQTPEGLIQRVGRNCLADFLMGDPSGMVALAEFEDALRDLTDADPDDDEKFYGGTLRWSPTMVHFLACAFASVESNGFVKADAEVGNPTKYDAMFLADGYNATHGERHSREDWKKRQPTQDHYIEVIGAMLWLEDEPRTSDYIHNLHVALQLTAITKINQGLVASVPAAYARHLGKLAAAKAEKEVLPESKHVGEVGKRLDLEVVVVGIHDYVSSEGEPKVVVKARTLDGADIVNFTGGKHPVIEDIGKTVSVRGTVKDHSTRNGRPQTVLSRCVWS